MEDDAIGTQWGVITVYRHIDCLLTSAEFYRGENSLTVYLKMYGLVKIKVDIDP
jgi:hypothetical protein